MTDADDNHETEDFRPRGVLQDLFRGPTDPRYRVVVWAFVLGSAAHLWLADAAQPDWMASNLLYVLGLIVLLISGGVAGWALCCVALAIPLLFLRDQLTQSVYMLAVSTAGAVYVGGRETRERVDSFLFTVQGLTIATYAFAAFHKVNRQFLDPLYSCANYGMIEVFVYWGLEPAWFAGLDPVWPAVALGTELAVPVAYLAGRRHLARIVAVVFHIPLTVTMAPAFAFVMAAGHAAFVTDDERRYLVAGLREHARFIVPGAVGLTAVSLAAHGAWPEPMMIPREFLLWFWLLWFGLVRPERVTDKLAARGASRFVIIGLFSLNCLMPYLGVQYQHAAAMLSNLRIDRGCWNHYVVPEAVRLTDDYVRVEEVYFGAPGRIEEYEQIVLTQLWSPPQILQMRRNWCRPEVRPLYLAGTFREEPWTIADLCDESESWPFSGDGLFGAEIFPDFLRFQKNLLRECPQQCIH